MQLRNKTWVLLGLLSALGSPSTASADGVAFVCKTKKHHIVIDKAGESTYRYRAWNLPKKTTEAPDLQLRQENAFEIEGTGPCRSTSYTFHNGNVEYLVVDGAGCTEEMPPEGAIGFLSVSIDGVVKAGLWCF